MQLISPTYKMYYVLYTARAKPLCLDIKLIDHGIHITVDLPSNPCAPSLSLKRAISHEIFHPESPNVEPFH